jgi:protoheme IX farnesyltransferase
VSERHFALYAELTKARLGLLVVATAVAGFLEASAGPIDWVALSAMALGTGLAAFGSNALNQVAEVSRDARMERTKSRPLPSGRLDLRHGLLVGLLFVITGPAVLAVLVNPLAAALSLIAVLVYALVYTPLKPRTPLCTLVGALCGAIPPMIGWAAGAGRLELGAWILGAILYVWQIPHFLSLAWLYRDDYARGGFRMLPAVDESGRLTGAAVVLCSLALVPLGLMPTLSGMAGWAYGVASVVLGVWLVVRSVGVQRERDDRSARRLFRASLVYLSLLMLVLVADPGPDRARQAPASVPPRPALVTPPALPGDLRARFHQDEGFLAAGQRSGSPDPERAESLRSDAPSCRRDARRAVRSAETSLHAAGCCGPQSASTSATVTSERTSAVP